MTNIEIKASCNDLDQIREILKKEGAEFVGLDQQTDTYFNSQQGRLKLREGNIENCLIHYQRQNQAGPKVSEVMLYHPQPSAGLKELLSVALGVRGVVRKKREIYFIENVKFHLDSVEQLGAFVEIEAIDASGDISRETLLEQCKTYLSLFDISAAQLINNSYSDMILEKSDGPKN
ncbi:MAG TPA: CYTH domain-containing protein [bacterium]|nr:CYTH domain-containing protein [bacterium]